MKKLLIYYSLTGNVELVKEKLNIESREVTPKHHLPKSFFWMVMIGGMLSGLNKKSKLVNYNNDVSNYDEVIICSPIWNAKFACPINTVLAKTDLTNKKVTFILCAGSGEAPKAEAKIKKLYPNASIIKLQEPKKHPEELEKLNSIT